MTVPQERDDDPVLDILGLATPAALEPVDGPAEPVRPFSPSREIVSAPLTRRELRDRERTDDTPAPRRAAPSTRSKLRAAPRRMAKNTSRRDVWKLNATPAIMDTTSAAPDHSPASTSEAKNT